jgi:hypothetical protein
MGNRAVISFCTGKSAPCIYLHWNGGRPSIEAFLKTSKHLGLNQSILDAHDDTRYDVQAEVMDKIAEMIAKHFFDCEVGRTVYRETYGNSDADNGDNGVYLIDRKLDIIGRVYNRYPDNEEVNMPIYNTILESVAKEQQELEA